MGSTQSFWQRMCQSTWSILVKKVILVELLLVPGKYILHFLQKVLLQNKMFQITSGNDVWPYFLDLNIFLNLVFLVLNFHIVLLLHFAANLGLFKMLGFHANRRECLVLSLLFLLRQSSKFWPRAILISCVGLEFW